MVGNIIVRNIIEQIMPNLQVMNVLIANKSFINFDYFSHLLSVDYLLVLMKLMKDVNGPTRVYLGPRVYVVISNPEDVKTLTMTTGCLNKLDVYRFFHCPTGLATAPG